MYFSMWMDQQQKRMSKEESTVVEEDYDSGNTSACSNQSNKSTDNDGPSNEQSAESIRSKNQSVSSCEYDDDSDL